MEFCFVIHETKNGAATPIAVTIVDGDSIIVRLVSQLSITNSISILV